MIGSVPDFEYLSRSEDHLVTKALGVLLGDDYRGCFLPALLELCGLAEIADWGAHSVRSVFFSRPLRACMHERASGAAEVTGLQAEITRFLALPEVFNLRRNVNGKLTQPRGWNRRFIAQMLRQNPDLVAESDSELIEAKLWLFEELADTEVSVLLQAESVLVLCSAAWLADPWRTSRKPSLKEYRLSQVDRQYLVGLYLGQTTEACVHHLALTCSSPAKRCQTVRVGRLADLVPSIGSTYVLHHVTWQDVYELGQRCLPLGHGLLEYMAAKRARRGSSTLPLVK